MLLTDQIPCASYRRLTQGHRHDFHSASLETDPSPITSPVWLLLRTLTCLKVLLFALEARTAKSPAVKTNCIIWVTLMKCIEYN